MRRLSHVIAVVCLVLVTAPGNLAMCAGWKPTPEARMACCATDGMCPMRTKAARPAAMRHAVSQQAADACCAAATRDDAPPSGVFALAAPVAMWAFVMAPVEPRPEWHRATRASESPPPGSGISRHLFLSVILI